MCVCVCVVCSVCVLGILQLEVTQLGPAVVVDECFGKSGDLVYMLG